MRTITGSLLIAAVFLGCFKVSAQEQPSLKLFTWDRGIGVQISDHPDMKMYLWFYEWNMFDAMETGQHTRGYRVEKREASEDARRASLESKDFQLEATAGAGSVDLVMKVTNNSDHDWPELAAIIPCLNPGPSGRCNKQMANTHTHFHAAGGLEKLHAREIHFNHDYRKAIDKEAKEGKYAWSDKWPKSEVDATAGLLVRESTDGRFVTGIAWEDFISAQGHNPWKCMHLSIRVGPLGRGQSKTVRGKIYLLEGTRQDLMKRYAKDLSVMNDRKTFKKRRTQDEKGDFHPGCATRYPLPIHNVRSQ